MQRQTFKRFYTKRILYSRGKNIEEGQWYEWAEKIKLHCSAITTEEKISECLEQISVQGSFDTIKSKIKIKLFDFDDAFDNSQIMGYVMKKLSEYGFLEKHEIIAYGEKIKFIKVEEVEEV